MDLHPHMICQHNEIRRERNTCGRGLRQGTSKRKELMGRGLGAWERVRTATDGGDNPSFLAEGTCAYGGTGAQEARPRRDGISGIFRGGFFWSTLCIYLSMGIAHGSQ
ncbi:hypothetical protein C8Q77DRAFT_257522 [Trametes polyzona]|nr:hypothetical protein C8Q77DRAFT_257522 [Trametes polyzona]